MDLRVDSRSLLSSLLAPVPVDEFLSTYWLTHHLFCRGSVDRVSTLLSWPELNELLVHHWRETFRFRLALQGRDLNPSSYADLEGVSPKIRSKDLTDHLRRGATLSFDAIDEIHEPLTRLARQFEALFQGSTQINAYAGWRALHGLDLHRDDQEVFILQLSGRKRWLLYGFSIEGVDCSRLMASSEPPASAVFDQILEPGDLLYIPRGCYHVAVPMNEPTLHLTLGVKNPRGIDVLQWMVERVKATEIAGRDLPILVDRAERLRYVEQLRCAILDGLDADLVEQYLMETGSNLKPRPSLSLPWTATAEALPAGRQFTVQMNARVQVVSNGSGAVGCELRVSGRAFSFPHSMLRVVEQLAGGSSQSFGEIMSGLGGRIDEETVRLLLTMLVTQGLVEIRA